MAKYEGAGGYGGISTLNQDQRQGKYFPHINIFILKQHPFKLVRCFTCNTQWSDGEEYPATCKPASGASEITRGQK